VPRDLIAYRKRRRRALAAAAKAAKVDALLVSRAADVTYLCGFDGEDSYLLLGRGVTCLITDGRFAAQAARQCGRISVHVCSGPVSRAVATVAAKARVHRLGVQATDMTVGLHNALAAAVGAGVAIKAVGDVLLTMRAVKDPREVAGIRRAVRLAERAFRQLLAGGAKALVGRTERDVAAELDWRMRRLGADSPAFDTIVAVGPNSALPHHRPGRDRVRAGRAVLIDWGAWAGGFSSDLTRVVFLARIPPALRGVYDVVIRARRAGLAELAGGAQAAEADRAARAVIDSAGYGECFVHGLGHGLGRGRGNREVHELPHLSRWSKETLRAGMVVTVEPGVYLPGVGGIRIEDDVLITAGGWRRLSTLAVKAEAFVLR
jgi:Xaa-Pro aminopeptidase